MIADFPLKEHPTFLETKAISKFVIEMFLTGEVDKVSVLFPRFVNTLTQKPTALTLLPITSLEEAGLTSDEAPIPEPEGDILFEPGPERFSRISCPTTCISRFSRCFSARRASEHSARMVAMKSATDNAKEIVKDLTLEYNKARQANITTELLEISTAQTRARLTRHYHEQQRKNRPSHRSRRGRRIQPAGRGTAQHLRRARNQLHSVKGTREADARGPATSWRKTGCAAIAMSSTEGLKRGIEVTEYRRPDFGSGGRGRAWPHFQCRRRAHRPARSGRVYQEVSDSSYRSSAY